nr:hypothetical protein [Tanacetum cinerariifolium]
MAQNVLPAAQLVPQVKPIGRCNNYAVLQSIPCSPECKIVGQILHDHPLSYALTATGDVSARHYTSTSGNSSNPFVEPANIQTIEAFMNRVGYQGVVNKVSAFYTKNLAQPWQTMLQVFNRCLTTRTTGHDQTKINILQLFHVVINRTNVDYAALLWWGFMSNVFQKKEAIQYPRFIKLIIVDLMTKFPNIPKRLEEDYHSTKDYVLLVSVYTTGNVLVRGMLILDAFLTAEIRETADFMKGTPRSLRSPTVFASPQEKKKRKQIAGESISRRIVIKKMKQTTPSIPPPGDDRERDVIAEATLLSLTLHKTALEAEARENIAKVQEKLDEEEIEKIFEGEEYEESYASAYADSMFNDDVDDTDSKIEPKSHKEKPDTIDDDVMNFLSKKRKMKKLKKKRKEQKQTPIPSPIRSPKNVSSSDKTISEELTAIVSQTIATTSKILSKLKPGSESRPPMLNKENYVPSSSRLLRYAKSRPNKKLIYNSILNGPYVRRMIAEPGDGERDVNVNETFHEQTDDELSERELKQIEADDQAMQTILRDLPEDIYAAVDSCKTAQEIWLRVQQMMKGSDIGIQEKKEKLFNEWESCETDQEIWLRVQQMMKGSDIGIQEKKAKLFNEWERFTSNEGESIESYYHRFLKLMNDLKRNKHFPEKIASNLKFLNNLRPEWSRHIQDPLALMANSNNLYASPAPHQDLSPFNQNYMQQPMPNPEDITDSTTAMNMALALMAKAFKLNYSTPTNNNQRISSNPRNRQIAQPGMNMGQDRQMQMIRGNGGNQFRQYAGQNAGNLNGYNAVQNVRNQVAQNPRVQNDGNQNQIGNGNLV